MREGRSWRRRVAVILMLLVAGAAMNVAMAWGCVTDLNPFQFTVHRSPAGQLEENLFRRSNFWERFGHKHEEREFGLLLTSPVVEFPSHPNVLVHAGWPSLSLSCSGHSDNGLINIDSFVGWQSASLVKQFDDGILLGTRMQTAEPTHLVVPLQPLWPGFAINTLFYAALWWAMFMVPATLRCRRRLKHGLCPACAYPIGSSTVCTECGQAIRLRRA